MHIALSSLYTIPDSYANETTPIYNPDILRIQTTESTIKTQLNDWISIKNTNLVRQKHDYSCGTSATATIMRYYYNLDIDEMTVLNSITASNKLLKLNQNNIELFISFKDLMNFAKSINYKALGLAVSIDSLGKLQVPAIVHIKVRNNEHFSVYKGKDNQYVYLADPSFGNIKIRIHKFKEMFVTRKDLKYPGKILVFIPDENNTRVVRNQAFMKITKRNDLNHKTINIDRIRRNLQ